MSGGSFDYGYFKVQMLADEIENMFAENLAKQNGLP